MVVLAGTLVGCGQQTSGSAVPAGVAAASATTTTAAASSAPATTTSGKPKPSTTALSTSGNDVIGPSGWGPVKIHMKEAQAAATGVFPDHKATEGICIEWFAPNAAPIESAIISPNLGVIAIVARAGAKIHTPEGVEVGSTPEQVHAAYPATFQVADATFPNGKVIPSVGDEATGYRLTFHNGTLTRLMLESLNQDCYG